MDDAEKKRKGKRKGIWQRKRRKPRKTNLTNQNWRNRCGMLAGTPPMTSPIIVLVLVQFVHSDSQTAQNVPHCASLTPWNTTKFSFWNSKLIKGQLIEQFASGLTSACKSVNSCAWSRVFANLRTPTNGSRNCPKATKTLTSAPAPLFPLFSIFFIFRQDFFQNHVWLFQEGFFLSFWWAVLLHQCMTWGCCFLRWCHLHKATPLWKLCRWALLVEDFH